MIHLKYQVLFGNFKQIYNLKFFCFMNRVYTVCSYVSVRIFLANMVDQDEMVHV